MEILSPSSSTQSKSRGKLPCCYPWLTAQLSRKMRRPTPGVSKISPAASEKVTIRSKGGFDIGKELATFPFQDCQLYPAITFNFPAGTPPAHECFRTKQNHSMKKLPGRHSLHKNFSFPVRFCQLFNFHGLLQSNRSCKLPINADPFGSDNCQVISLVSKRIPRTIPVSDISKLS